MPEDGRMSGHSSLCPFKRGPTEAEVIFHHRIRSRQTLGLGEDFCPNLPKLARKVFCATFAYKFSPTKSSTPFLV